MSQAFGWVLFGMAVWGLCILMQALERRFVPEGERMWNMGGHSRKARREKSTATGPAATDPRDEEIAALKKRVETLEAIVTDPRFQWEQELRR